MAPSHEEEGPPAGEVLHEPGTINPGGGGLRSALRGALLLLAGRRPTKRNMSSQYHENFEALGVAGGIDITRVVEAGL